MKAKHHKRQIKRVYAGKETIDQKYFNNHKSKI